MQWTEQGGRGRRPRPPCGVNNIGIYGHGVGLSLFGLGGPINSKSAKSRNLVRRAGEADRKTKASKNMGVPYTARVR